MLGAQWILEGALVLLLGATLFHALRLERALGVLKRDRAVLEELVEGFNESTRQAETGIERLRHAADGAGRQMARQIETAQRLRDDLSFLADRSDKLAERLEGAVRSARMVGDGSVLQAAHTAPAHTPPAHTSLAPPLQPALAPMPAPAAYSAQPSYTQPSYTQPSPPPRIAPQHRMEVHQEPRYQPPQHQKPRLHEVVQAAEPEEDAQPRLRSQAERDLLRALRGAR
jgi:hypothetical protein